MAKRIFTMFSVWSLVYALPFNPDIIFQSGVIGTAKIVARHLYFIVNQPCDFFLVGTKSHLWFLPALLISLFISSIMIAGNRVRLLIFGAVVLYVVGLLTKSYANTPLGLNLHFNTRNGPYFGLIFFVSGYVLSGQSPNQSWFVKGLLLMVAGYVLQFSELIVLHFCFGATLAQDFVVGTYFVGMGAALVAFSNVSFLRFQVACLIGSWASGIYVAHMVFVDLLKPINRLTASPLWQILYVLVVFGLSAITTISLSKVGQLKRFL